MYVYVCMYIYICVHTCMYVCIIYIYIHIHIPPRWGRLLLWSGSSHSTQVLHCCCYRTLVECKFLVPPAARLPTCWQLVNVHVHTQAAGALATLPAARRQTSHASRPALDDANKSIGSTAKLNSWVACESPDVFWEDSLYEICTTMYKSTSLERTTTNEYWRGNEHVGLACIQSC